MPVASDVDVIWRCSEVGLRNAHLLVRAGDRNVVGLKHVPGQGISDAKCQCINARSLSRCLRSYHTRVRQELLREGEAAKLRGAPFWP